MSEQKTMYAVVHLQRGSGSDAGMTVHIERKTKDGKAYVPVNADPSRTHLNRELIKFPDGVHDRTEAIQHRINHAELHRKVAKNQTKAIRIILTGTHEQMIELERTGRLNDWIDANKEWLQKTFGKDNVVSVVLHMDEKTPHLHATVVPIVTEARHRRQREGERKYQTKEGPRLSSDDVMHRPKLKEYQDSYAAAMKPFGLERGIVGSTAKHKSLDTYYKERAEEIQGNIDALLVEVEKAKEGKSKILSWFGKGDLAKAKKEIKGKDDEIEKLKAEIAKLKQEKKDLAAQHKQDHANLRNGYQTEIDKAIAKAEKAENDAATKQSAIEQRDQTIAARDKTISDKNAEIKRLHRLAYPERYTLSSGAKLIGLHINRTSDSVSFDTQVGTENFHQYEPQMDRHTLQRFYKGELTNEELVNALFEPWEQVNEVQAKLLGAAFELACGGPAQAHVGTGGGGSTQSETGWDGKKRKGLGV